MQAHAENRRLSAAQALLLRGMIELCVLPPQLDASRSSHNPVHEVQWSCSDAALLRVLQSRDPTGQGPPGGRLGLRLVRSLLSWDPAARPTAAVALRHVVFAVDEGLLDQDVGCDEALAAVHHEQQQKYWC